MLQPHLCYLSSIVLSYVAKYYRVLQSLCWDLKSLLLFNWTGGEQLEQSREVIRKLNEEKSHLEQEMRQRIENSETTLEREKDSELQELRRGKVEALRVLQVSRDEITAGSRLRCVWL